MKQQFAPLAFAAAFSAALPALVLVAQTIPQPAFGDEQPATQFAVGPQYDSTHVYVAPADLDAFVASFIGTFGGSASPKISLSVTPEPSTTAWRFITSPVGSLSVFGFTTPIPYPFGSERTGYLVTDMDAAVAAAQHDGADLIVATFPDPVGRDAVVQWPGGVNMQLYWHTVAPHAPPLVSIPENRVYVSRDRADAFVRAFRSFSGGIIDSDDAAAPGIEIGLPGTTFRAIRLHSGFGAMTVIATDGHLPFPYGREISGYAVTDLDATLAKAKANGARVLVPRYDSSGRAAAMLSFPGGYIAELHAAL
jgi:predicted enzyme related to lactoylglutathione lyase